MSRPPAIPPDSVIEMTGVTIPRLNDARRIVASEVNWTVRAKDFWVVTGMHDSGKTDFMLLAAGLLPPIAGDIRLLGREPTDASTLLEWRRHVGFVFDGGQLLGDLTLAENVALPLRYHGLGSEAEIRSRVENLLNWTGLTKLSHSRPASIGRNWRQRAGLARALALNPKVLLLDSPLIGLDPLDAAWWLEALKNLGAGPAPSSQESITLVVAGNDPRPWRSIARQYAVLQNSRFVLADAGTICAAGDDDPIGQTLGAGGLTP
jgi:phospholipid/cholesterol/gamma-HCH transport system ATP-binding protein